MSVVSVANIYIYMYTKHAVIQASLAENIDAKNAFYAQELYRLHRGDGIAAPILVLRNHVLTCFALARRQCTVMQTVFCTDLLHVRHCPKQF